MSVGVSSHLLAGAYPHTQFNALCRSIAMELTSDHLGRWGRHGRHDLKLQNQCARCHVGG